ncbi:hypothetical protein HNR62_001083 [Oceanisphaera litoralis]|uniref:hypothetical protein n=1 Tax=Oceanisphaera litoralis TaxID=225144 RepID=UPI00195ACC84|nr:hypothetical protein [Oceanisphaera litoralis]MBM7455223.1 hypothetical protein [Oceanisphaera litoralis]
MTPNINMGQVLADQFYQMQIAIQDMASLKQQLSELQQEVSMLRESGGDQGWMTIKKAANIMGLNSPALAQRFRRGVYPEGVVWAMENNRYIVNLRALREHMARGQH